MNKKKNNRFSNRELVLLSSIFVLILACSFLLYLYFNIKKTNENLIEESLVLNNEIQTLKEEIENKVNENVFLSQELESEKEKVGSLARDVADIGDVVGVLDKLSKTDEELLQKYSKVYFLNEHYRPAELSLLEEDYVYQDKEIYLHTKVIPFLEDMIEEALDDGVDIRVVSGFRSFDEQSILKNGYSVTYGAGTANQFSADQGYSEHQLGTTVDIVNSENGATLSSSFAQTESYDWLLDNAHRFGFTLSYPENNSYYQFEPWHWRFVGVDLASDLHQDGKSFYDLEQREIDKYLVEIFD